MIDKENGVATWEIVVFSQCVSLLYMLLYIALLKTIWVRLLTPSKNAMAMAIVITKHKGICANNCFAHFALGMFRIIWHTIMVRLMKTLAFPSAHLMYRSSTKGNNKFTIIFNKKTISVVCIRNWGCTA